MNAAFSFLIVVALGATLSNGDQAPAAPPPCAAQQMKAVLEMLDPATMKSTVDKLASFGTRHTLSDVTSATRGIGAARRWIHDEFARYAKESGGNMTVSYQSSMQESKRTNGPAEVVNVLGTIRGRSDASRVYIATGHYDSINSDVMDAIGDAPGADDDASGVAVIMEVARVLSRFPIDATVVLGAVAGEEQGLLGSKGLVDHAAIQGWNVEGMITNDIVGGVEGGGGRVDNHTVRIFSANVKGVGDSTSRHFARYVREVVRSHAPAVEPRLVYRLDRFGRGGDHIPFFEKGLPAIRFTEANENYRRQHQTPRTENGVEYGDLPRFVSGDYLQKVASMNAVTLASAACAPAAPREVKVQGAVKNDTTLSWQSSGDRDLRGYELLVRETTSDAWERTLWLGNVTEYTLESIPIDNYFFGVRAVDADGNRSPVRTPDGM